MIGRLRNLLAGARARPVVAVICVAAFVRLIAVLVLRNRLFELAPDGEYYFAIASDRSNDAYEFWTFRDHLRYDNFAAFFEPLTALFRVLSPSTLLAQAYAAALGVLAAGIVALIGTRFWNATVGLTAGLVVALMPNSIVWSSVILRDSSVWALTALTAYGLMTAMNGADRDTALRGTLCFGGGLYLLAHARTITMIVTAIVAIPAMLIVRKRGAIRYIVACALFALIVPWASGFGPFGADYLRGQDLDQMRIARANDAESGVVDAGEEKGKANQAPDLEDEGGNRTLSHLSVGLRTVLLDPLPTSDIAGSTARAAQVELVVWLPVLGLAALGVIPILRKRSPLLYPLAIAAGMTVVYASAEGNFGTAYRHRAELIPAVGLSAGVAISQYLERKSSGESIA